MNDAPHRARLPGLARKRVAARLALWWERLWPAMWPALGVAGVFAAAALLDLPSLLPPWPRLALPVLAVLAVVGLAAWYGRQARVPGADAADRRLETVSGLRHRPLSVLADRPATPSAEAAALWQAHQARVLNQVGRLRVGLPRPGLARRDRIALRGLVVVALAAALAVAGPDAPARLWRGLAPGLPAGPAEPGTTVQAWITPPAYTGLPPVFLQPGQPAPPVPVNAHLTVSVTGGRAAPSLFLGDEPTSFGALDATSWQAERDLPRDGRLSVRRGNDDLAAWTLTTIPDRPPTATFTDPPGPALSAGRPTQQTRLSWAADDDYGVVAVQLRMRLRDRPDAPPLVVAAPVSGNPRDTRGLVLQDLTPHPWAGLDVLARVVAKDAPGQEGESAEASFTLPERRFRNPAAQAVIAVRKQLSLTPEKRDDARTALDALADHPDLLGNSFALLLNLRAAGALLGRAPGQPAVDEAQSRLWDLAVALEENGMDRSARALAEARQRVRDALEVARQDPYNAEKRAELDRRLQELREAIQKQFEALAEQARREGTEMPLDPNQPQLNSRDMDRMAESADRAAREGRMEDAQRQMADLEKLLEQLQNARPEHGEQREQRNAERRQQGRQQQDAVQDLVRRQGELLDRSRSRTDTPAPGPSRTQPPSPTQPGAQPGAPPGAQNGTQPTPPSREQDTRRQQAMRRALGELMQRFGDLTGEVPAPLGEADLAMREAAQASGTGQDGAAAAAQQRAIEALQKGNRAMGQQMARQFGRDRQQGQGQDGGEGEDGGDGQDGPDGPGTQAGNGEDPGGNADGRNAGPRPGEERGPARRRSARRDPLGRPLGDGVDGRSESNDVRVPDQMEQARTRALQDELRRRGGERSRPQNELDYIDRLLKSF